VLFGCRLAEGVDQAKAVPFLEAVTAGLEPQETPVVQASSSRLILHRTTCRPHLT
jgi:hypothetical protein